jgi:hypothetical protein
MDINDVLTNRMVDFAEVILATIKNGPLQGAVIRI